MTQHWATANSWLCSLLSHRHQSPYGESQPHAACWVNGAMGVVRNRRTTGESASSNRQVLSCAFVINMAIVRVV